MPVFLTAYDTTVCADFVINKIQQDLARALIENQGDWVGPGLYALQRGDTAGFYHPMRFEKDGGLLALDMRNFGTYDARQQTWTIRNQIEYGVALRRGQLNKVWLVEDPLLLRDASPLPIQLYAAWISETVAARFGLNPAEQQKLAVLAAYFYLGLFTTENDWEEAQKARAAAAISRAVHTNVQDIMTIIEDLPILTDIRDFCRAMEKVTDSVRLRDFNSGLLVSILGGTWFGTNSRELVAVAIEHPPTWMSIVLAAYHERTFRNTKITRLAESRDRRGAGQTYIRTILRLCDQVLANQ